MSRNIRYIDAEKIQFLPLSVKIGCNKYNVYGAEPERVIMEIHDMVAYKGDIDAIPTADVEEVRHGEWRDEREDFGTYVCSVCNRPYGNQYNYCPNCGAKMDKETEE